MTSAAGKPFHFHGPDCYSMWGPGDTERLMCDVGETVVTHDSQADPAVGLSPAHDGDLPTRVTSSCSCPSGVALEAAQQRLDDWRKWAQFVWLNGGPVADDDDTLRLRIVAEHDRYLREAKEAAEARLSTLQANNAACNQVAHELRQRADDLEARLSTLTQRLQQLVEQWKAKAVTLDAIGRNFRDESGNPTPLATGPDWEASRLKDCVFELSSLLVEGETPEKTQDIEP